MLTCPLISTLKQRFVRSFAKARQAQIPVPAPRVTTMRPVQASRRSTRRRWRVVRLKQLVAVPTTVNHTEAFDVVPVYRLKIWLSSRYASSRPAYARPGVGAAHEGGALPEPGTCSSIVPRGAFKAINTLLVLIDSFHSDGNRFKTICPRQIPTAACRPTPGLHKLDDRPQLGSHAISTQSLRVHRLATPRDSTSPSWKSEHTTAQHVAL